jgi:CHAT domain-containing protein
MKRLLSFAVILSFAAPAFAQIDPGNMMIKARQKVKDQAGKVQNGNLPGNELTDKAKSMMGEQLDKTRSEYDESNFNYAISFSDNAGLFENKEKGDRNRMLLMDAVAAADKESVSLEEKARNLNNTGEMLYASNKFKGAEVAFKRSIELYTESGNAESKEIALVISNLALLYHTTGRYTKAAELTEQALQLRTRVVPGSPELAASINNKAVLYKDMGRFNEAESLIEHAVNISSSTAGKKSLAYVLALNNKAMLFQSIGRNEAAEGMMKESTTIAKELMKESSSNYIKLTINLALLYQDMKKYNEAEAIYLNAIKLKEKKLGKNHPDYAHLKKGLASLYLLMGKKSEVEELLKTASDIYKKKFGEEHPSYAAAISDLGNFYRSENRLADAEPLLVKALEVRKKLLGEAHPDYVRSLEDMAILQWQQKKITEASANYKTVIEKTSAFIDEYFAPMSESEKTKFWDKTSPRFQRFNSFASEAMEQDKELASLMMNNQLNTKAMLLNSTSKVRNMIMNSGDAELTRTYLQWLDQKENLARLYTLSKEELAEEKTNLDSLEKAANSTEKKLSAASGLFSEGYAQVTYKWQDVAKHLADGEAVVDIVQFRKYKSTFTDSVYYAAMIIDKSSASPRVVLLKNGKDLENIYIKQYRTAIKDQGDDTDAYKQFWSEIDKAVAGKTKLFLSLDGAYNQISINTLKDDKGKYIIDSKSIVLVGNSKDVIKIKTAPKTALKKTATLFGYPNYGTDEVIPPLPGTKIEVENIEKTLQNSGYKTQTYMAEKANEANVKAAKTEIVHIATHGFFLSNLSNVEEEKVLGIETSTIQKNPLHRSGILLSGCETTILGENGDHSTSNNGILTAYEAMNMSLENTDLVVLSACETGLGDIKSGEGVYGLQRAFQVAGARSVIMSLWQVSDEATQQLMSSFYKNLAASGNKQDAFLKAQKEIKAKFPHPFYWGAFVLVGN